MDIKNIVFKGFHPSDKGNEIIYIGNQIIKGFWVKGDFASPDKIVFEKNDIWDDYNIIPITLCAFTGMYIGEIPIFGDDVLEWISDDGIEHELVSLKNGAWVINSDYDGVELLYDNLCLDKLKVLGNVFSFPKGMGEWER